MLDVSHSSFLLCPGTLFGTCAITIIVATWFLFHDVRYERHGKSKEGHNPCLLWGRPDTKEKSNVSLLEMLVGLTGAICWCASLSRYIGFESSTGFSG